MVKSWCTVRKTSRRTVTSKPFCYFSTYSVRNVVNMIPRSDNVFGHFFRYRYASIKRPQTRNLIYWTTIANLLLKMNSPFYCHITPDGFPFLHNFFLQIFFVLFDTNSVELMSALQFWFFVVGGENRISKGVKWENFSDFFVFGARYLIPNLKYLSKFLYKSKRKMRIWSDENVASSRLRRNILIYIKVYTWVRLTP